MEGSRGRAFRSIYGKMEKYEIENGGMKKMLKVKLDGEIFEGDPAAILLEIKNRGIDFSGTNTLDEYMDWLAKNVFKMKGVGVSLPDGPTDERAAALVSQLIHAGLFEKVNH